MIFNAFTIFVHCHVHLSLFVYTFSSQPSRLRVCAAESRCRERCNEGHLQHDTQQPSVPLLCGPCLFESPKEHRHRHHHSFLELFVGPKLEVKGEYCKRSILWLSHVCRAEFLLISMVLSISVEYKIDKNLA